MSCSLFTQVKAHRAWAYAFYIALQHLSWLYSAEMNMSRTVDRVTILWDLNKHASMFISYNDLNSTSIHLGQVSIAIL